MFLLGRSVGRSVGRFVFSLAHRSIGLAVIAALAFLFVTTATRTSFALRKVPDIGTVTQIVERSASIARADGKSVEESKPAEATASADSKPERVKRSKTDVISDCIKAAYAALNSESTALRALHTGDDDAFARAYAKRKEELVGDKALRLKGCAEAREDK